MKHNYAKDKLELLLRDLSNYTADEFRRQMMRIASGATGQDIPDDAHTIKAERDALLKQSLNAVYIYNCGYASGHADTVNGCFVDVLSQDKNSYHSEDVEDLIRELANEQPEQIRQGGAK